MTTTITKCPTCNADAVDRSTFLEAAPENGQEISLRLFEVKKAVSQYHLALDQMLRKLDRHPGLKQIYK